MSCSYGGVIELQSFSEIGACVASRLRMLPAWRAALFRTADADIAPAPSTASPKQKLDHSADRKQAGIQNIGLGAKLTRAKRLIGSLSATSREGLRITLPRPPVNIAYLEGCLYMTRVPVYHPWMETGVTTYFSAP
jgi:hypothetical protein